MGMCPSCNELTFIGHFHAQSWRVDLEMDPKMVHLPIPFWKDRGSNLERGKHHLRIGNTCDVAAKRFALRVFPEASVVRLVRCDISGEPVVGSESLTVLDC